MTPLFSKYQNLPVPSPEREVTRAERIVEGVCVAVGMGLLYFALVVMP